MIDLKQSISLTLLALLCILFLYISFLSSWIAHRGSSDNPSNPFINATVHKQEYKEKFLNETKRRLLSYDELQFQSRGRKADKSSKFFFIDSPYVYEATSGEAFRRIKDDERPLVLMLYYSWCPHCQNFRNVYEQIAKTTFDLGNIVDIGSNHAKEVLEIDKDTIDTKKMEVLFLAVNCGRFKDFCDKRKFRFEQVPSLAAFHFHTAHHRPAVEEDDYDLEPARVDSLPTYLEKHLYRAIYRAKEGRNRKEC